MPGIQGHDLAVFGAVSQVEIVGTYRIAFQPDAEQFGLDTVLHVGIRGGEYLVERIFEDLAVFQPVGRDFLTAVVYPQVHDARVALRFTHFFADGAAAFGMFDPEIPDTLVGVGQGQIAALGMGKRSAVEIQFHIVLLGPLHPAGEMFGGYLVPVYFFAGEIPVYLVQVQPVASRDKRSGLEDVGAQFVDIAGSPRIVACHLDASGE